MIDNYNDIQQDVERILTYSQDYPFTINASKLMEQWTMAKESFISLFNGKTKITLKKKVKICLSKEQQNHKFLQFIDQLDSNGLLTSELEEFLMTNKDGFFENKVLCPYPTLNIKPGVKLSKSLKNFISNPTSVRWAQDVASRFIQENKVEGYLCLSIDPRDFLTLSESDTMNGWTSCHALDGDYRAGDLNYMVDSSTIIAYLCDDENTQLRCMPNGMKWNNKKWRMLIHIDSELQRVIYYNKQYPFESKELLDKTHNFLTSLITSSNFSKPTDYGFKTIKGQFMDGMLPYNQLNAGGRTFDTRDIIDVSQYIGFCDLIQSSTYSPVVAVNEELLYAYIDKYCYDDSHFVDEFIAFKELFGITIGRNAICPLCGEHYITREDKFICDTCIAEYDADEDFFLRCEECGRRLYDGEICVKDGEICCSKCYNALMYEDSVIQEEEENE